jgi:uncharacterized Zn finger protein (UPF0148 family)
MMKQKNCPKCGDERDGDECPTCGHEFEDQDEPEEATETDPNEDVPNHEDHERGESPAEERREHETRQGRGRKPMEENEILKGLAALLSKSAQAETEVPNGSPVIAIGDTDVVEMIQKGISDALEGLLPQLEAMIDSKFEAITGAVQESKEEVSKARDLFDQISRGPAAPTPNRNTGASVADKLTGTTEVLQDVAAQSVNVEKSRGISLVARGFEAVTKGANIDVTSLEYGQAQSGIAPDPVRAASIERQLKAAGLL